MTCAAAGTPDGPVRHVRGVQGAIVAVLIGSFLAADLLRNEAHPSYLRQHVTVGASTPTLLSMLAWAAFASFFVVWARARRGWLRFISDVGRVAVLAALSIAVLFAYYRRSEVLTAGVHIDAAYTYVGLKWFTELRNPVTFAGLTPSYDQFPMALFTHLPALMVGFGCLGAFSAHFGIMLQVAVLLATATAVLARGSLASEAVTLTLLAAAFSNRMMVLSYDKAGYAIPAVCLGLMFMVAVDRESAGDADRTIGGLLCLALLHFWTGFLFVLPACLVWLIGNPRPVSRLRSFLAANSPVLVVMLLFLITLSTNPALLLARVRDVTVQTQAASAETLLRKVRTGLPYLVHTFPAAWYEAFCVRNGGSWHLLNVPPLGDVLVPLVGASWLLSWWTMRERSLRHPVHLVALAALLAVLSALQHLLTDWADYRDFTLIFALLVSSLLFVLRAQRLDALRRVAAVAFALALAAYNWIDLGKLHGKLHLSHEYAERSQETMEHLTAFVRTHGPAQLGVARIAAVVDPLFPLGSLYVEDLQRRGFSSQLLAPDGFCADPARTLEGLASVGCEGVLVVANARHCERWDDTGLEPPDRPVAGYLYESVCDRRGADLLKRPHHPVDLDG